MKEIRQIIAFYNKTDHANEKLALATVVKVEESSYRRIGARMIVSSSGQWIGGISGGCLEGDALKRSKLAIFKNEPSTVIYDTLEDDSHSIGIGLGCNGRIEVLFTPIDPNSPDNPIEYLKLAVANKKPTVLLHIIASNGDAALLGKTKLIADKNEALHFYGLHTDELQTAIVNARRKRRPHLLEIKDKAGVKYDLLVEYIRPETRLVVIGDNYDVNAFIRIAHELGWEIHLVGNLNKISKATTELVTAFYDYKNVDKVPIDEFTAVVLMTHDYKTDKALLPSLARINLSYLGLLGPRKRVEKLALELNLVELSNKETFFSPIGLDIGAETPEEIAVSIASEIIAVLRGRNGSSLKYRKGTIHERI